MTTLALIRKIIRIIALLILLGCLILAVLVFVFQKNNYYASIFIAFGILTLFAVLDIILAPAERMSLIKKILGIFFLLLLAFFFFFGAPRLVQFLIAAMEA